MVAEAFRDAATSSRFFHILEQAGFHLLPTHFYSPLPIVHQIPPETWTWSWEGTPGLKFDLEQQLDFLQGLVPWVQDLLSSAKDPPLSNPPLFNGKFDSVDAAVYYALLRQLRPKTVVECGAGYSSLFAARAITENNHGTLILIDPFPPNFLLEVKKPFLHLVPKPIQEIDFGVFTDLQPGDVLFYDGSHVSKTGSDVNHFVLKVLPRIKPGVWIHFHDIFLPYEYPRSWLEQYRLFWNEQYLVLAFLLFNPCFEVVAAHHALTQDRPEEVAALFPTLRPLYGCSLWLKKVVREGRE